MLSDDPYRSQPVPADDPEARLEQRDLLKTLEAVLDTLPMEQRAVFTMFEMEGMTGEEIASALAVPVGTVRSRLRLARESFTAAAARLARREVAASKTGGI